MTRQWEPGDVAEYDGIRVMFTQDEEGNRGAVDAEGDRRSGEAFRNSRPLVVIDPEDPEQVERLAEAWDDLGEQNFPLGQSPMAVRGYRMQAALREFANPTPPKPPEPRGHLAVVEDTEGVRWVSWRDPRDGPAVHERPWQSSQMDADEWRDYSDIAVVKVLSEGHQ